MTRAEAIKLLALIKVAYPTSYKDMDEGSLNATVAMWESTFPHTPYAIMEMAFERYRRRFKFPPTVAEMVDELRHIHYKATGDALTYASIRYDSDYVKRCRWVADKTAVFARGGDDYIDYSVVTDKMLISGGYKAIGGGNDG